MQSGQTIQGWGILSGLDIVYGVGILDAMMDSAYNNGNYDGMVVRNLKTHDIGYNLVTWGLDYEYRAGDFYRFLFHIDRLGWGR